MAKRQKYRVEIEGELSARFVEGDNVETKDGHTKIFLDGKEVFKELTHLLKSDPKPYPIKSPEQKAKDTEKLTAFRQKHGDKPPQSLDRSA